jgi:hypothetical protein
VSKPKMTLDEFAEAERDKRKGSHMDSLPIEIQEMILTSSASVATVKGWLISEGYEPTGLEAWRRNKRAERGIQPR